MKLIYDPSVYMVGFQQVEETDLSRFLNDHGITWETDTTNDTEKLCETAGRVCFDDKTEFLTTDGWISAAELTKDHQVATLNPATREVEFQEPVKVHSYEYDGDLICVDGRDLSFAVTPEHRQFAGIGTKYGYSEFQFHRTSALEGRRFQILTSAELWTGARPKEITIESVQFTQQQSNQFGNQGVSTRTQTGRIISGKDQVTALALLTAFYAANGSISDQKGTGRGIVIYGRDTNEIQSLASIIGLPSSVWVDPRNGCPRTVIGGGLPISNYFENECGRGYQAKRLPKWVLNLPSSELKKIWQVLVKTDGHRYENGREVYITGSPVMAGQVQELLLKISNSSYLTKIKGTKNYCFQISKKEGSPACVSKKKMFRVKYQGKVYCPSTKNGIVYVRRNGKVHFSGNCYMSFSKPRPGGNQAYLQRILESSHGSVLEHGVWNFIFTGISRSLSHELVRHRAGWGHSQLSQRYVDESVAEFVVPEDLRKEVSRAENYIMTRQPVLRGSAPSIWGQLLTEEIVGITTNRIKHPGETIFEGLNWMLDCITANHGYRRHVNYLDDRIRTDLYVEFKLQEYQKRTEKDSSEPLPDIQEWYKGLSQDEKTGIRKQARQAARSVLPNATETKIFCTANARAIRHFIEMRASRHAEPEIRKLAYQVWQAVKDDSPHLFGDYELIQLPDNTYELTTKYRKV